MSTRHLHLTRFRAQNMMVSAVKCCRPQLLFLHYMLLYCWLLEVSYCPAQDRIHCQQLTGKGTMALSFLPDDQHRPLMETETVALLPVLRRLEVTNVFI